MNWSSTTTWGDWRAIVLKSNLWMCVGDVVGQRGLFAACCAARGSEGLLQEKEAICGGVQKPRCSSSSTEEKYTRSVNRVVVVDERWQTSGCRFDATLWEGFWCVGQALDTTPGQTVDGKLWTPGRAWKAIEIWTSGCEGSAVYLSEIPKSSRRACFKVVDARSQKIR